MHLCIFLLDETLLANNQLFQKASCLHLCVNALISLLNSDRPLNTSVESENKIEWDSILEELKVFVRNIEADNEYEGAF